MSVLCLLDANVLIDANRDYYPIVRVPAFWRWLAEMGEQGWVKVPQEVYDKVVNARGDLLSEWLITNKDIIVLNEPVDIERLQRVIGAGYAEDLTDVEIEKLNEDPFLIAYALADVTNRCVVTTEHSRPKQIRANRQIPDVCEDFNVLCINTFALIRELDFRTGQ